MNTDINPSDRYVNNYFVYFYNLFVYDLIMIENAEIVDYLPVPEPRKGPGRKKGGTNKATRQALELVVNHGVEERTALMLALNKPKVSDGAVTGLRDKVARWNIEHPANQKVAHNTLLSFSAGKEVNGIVPKATDVRACAERIIDQATPVTRRVENLNINIDMHPVDLSRYL